MIDVMEPVFIPIEEPVTPSAPTANEVEILLDGLGTTCEQVAQALINVDLAPPALTASGVEDFLKTLGNTPEEVAESLTQRGITGFPRISDHCPLARLLAQHYNVGISCVGMDDGFLADSSGKVIVSFTIPLACSRFVCQFDEGGWPSLADEGLRPSSRF